MRPSLSRLTIIVALASAALAQCSPGTPSGTICVGFLQWNTPNPTQQTAVIMQDLGLNPPSPAVGKYILTISGGKIMESDSGGAWHSLVGPQGINGNPGPMGPPGPSTPMPKTVTGKITCLGWTGNVCNRSITFTITGAN